jgi:hypothetical protein
LKNDSWRMVAGLGAWTLSAELAGRMLEATMSISP